MVLKMLNFSLQKNHIDEPDAAFKNRAVVVVHEKIFNDVMALEAAFFIKRNCQRTVFGTNLQNFVRAAVSVNQKIY